jgi:ribosomal protein S15P/S13E
MFEKNITSVEEQIKNLNKSNRILEKHVKNFPKDYKAKKKIIEKKMYINKLIKYRNKILLKTKK